MRQIFEHDEVVAELGGTSFMTRRGFVIEGNYCVGEQVLLVFDKSSRRYLPAFRKKKEHVPEDVDWFSNHQIEAGSSLFCTVSLIDVPVLVKPMIYYADGQIHFGEIQGEDYFKTYYQVIDPGNCVVCPTDFNVCKHGQSDPARCKPFNYYKPDLPSAPGYPLNHCIWSLESCDAEILQTGSDNGGSYIIWKAYTDKTQGSSGLGYMRLMFFRKTTQGKIVCSADAYIKVDCCHKDAQFRRPKIYWTKCPGSFDLFCLIPDSVKFADIIYFWEMGGWIDMSLKIRPEKDGGCLPFTWNLEGMGELIIPSWDLVKQNVDYKLRAIDFYYRDCHDSITITATDRCYTPWPIKFKSCCEAAQPLSISYTTLIMTCGQTQTLAAVGGCAPYHWSSSGGGILTVDPNDSGVAYYQAPTTNPNCSSNGSISLTDCCSQSASISFAVNCYTELTLALRDCKSQTCTHPCAYIPEVGCAYDPVQGKWDYACNGVILGTAFIRYPAESIVAFDCSLQGGRWWGCGDYPGCPTSLPGCLLDPALNCCTPICETSCSPVCIGPCGLFDMRTTLMKQQGCCPLNPLTGLPY